MAIQNFYGCRDNSIVKGQVVTGNAILSRYKGLQIVNRLEFLNRLTRFQRRGDLITKYEACKVNEI